MSTQLRRTEEQMERIKRELLALGPMRPGSITRQYRRPKEKQRPFYQISYTHRMQSHTDYARPDNLPALRREIAAFRKFRKLIDRWVDTALKASKLRTAHANFSTRP
jgi:hypothetical protein